MKQKMMHPDIRRILRPYTGRVCWICVLTVLQSLLAVLIAMLSRFVIDAALKRGQDLLLWGGLLVADILAICGINALLSWYSGSTVDRISASMRKSILQTAVYSRNAQLLDHHSGELLNRGMEDVAIICDGTVSALPNLIGQVARLLAAFGAVLLIAPPVAGVLLVVAAVFGIGTACLRPLLKRHHRAVRESDERMMAALQENLQHLELIQSLDAQAQILDRFSGQVKKNLGRRFKRRILSVTTGSALGLAAQAGSGVLLLWGAAQIAAGALSYGSLTAMLQLMSQFRAPVLGLSGLWSRLTSVEVASDRLSVLLTPAEPRLQQSIEGKVRAVVFENVTFAYPGEEAPVLQDFSFRMPLDGWTCLTGVSGKGKTTMFKLILGLFQPQSGSVYLETDDGQIPCSEATRQLFAYVPQDYALFSGTVLENMQLVAPAVTDAQLRQALQIAQAEYVWDMTNKAHTQVRENNAGLSKGQLQRLAIARAVLMDRPVFLLDECTSALDAQTEDAVLRELKALGKQAILVTHRPEAVTELGGIDCISMEQ